MPTDSENKSAQEVRDECLAILLKLSDQQFDPYAKKQIPDLIGKSDEEVRKPLLFLLDDCVHGSLCSGFEITALDSLYRMAGGSDEEMQRWMPEREARHRY